MRQARSVAVLVAAFCMLTPGAHANDADEANTSWPRPFAGAPAGVWPPCAGSVASRSDNCVESVTWVSPTGNVDAAFVVDSTYDPAKPTKPQNDKGDFLDDAGQRIGVWSFPATASRDGFAVAPEAAISRSFIDIYMEGYPTPIRVGDRFRIVLRSTSLGSRILGVVSNASAPSITKFIGSDGIARYAFEGTAGYAASPILQERETAMCARDTRAVVSSVRMEVKGFFAADFPYLAQFPGQLVVSTNAVHSLAFPSWDGVNKVIRFSPCAPHYDVDGSLYKGYYETVIGGKLARELWGMEPAQAAAMAKVEITYSDGSQPEVATINSRYDKERDEIRLVAYNFHYSQPNIAVSVKAPKVVKKTITCVKGKTIKKVVGVKPVCPKGWTRSR